MSKETDLPSWMIPPKRDVDIEGGTSEYVDLAEKYKKEVAFGLGAVTGFAFILALYSGFKRQGPAQISDEEHDAQRRKVFWYTLLSAGVGGAFYYFGLSDWLTPSDALDQLKERQIFDVPSPADVVSGASK